MRLVAVVLQFRKRSFYIVDLMKVLACTWMTLSVDNLYTLLMGNGVVSL